MNYVRHLHKRLKHSLLSLLVGVLTLGPISTAFADDIYQQEDVMKIAADAGLVLDDFYKPKADIVIDANTGAILYGDNIDTVRDSGSMAKLMSAYVVFRALKEGKIKYDTVVTATEADQAISENNLLSNSPIVAGVDYKVSELIKMLFVPSSSAAVIMLANAVTDNDPDKFLDLMNQYAQEMGMSHTKWHNPNGAMISVLQGYYNPQRYDVNANNEITARDMSILAYHIVNDLPEMLEYTKQAHTTIMEGTPYEQSYDNYNTSLEGGKFANAQRAAFTFAAQPAEVEPYQLPHCVQAQASRHNRIADKVASEEPQIRIDIQLCFNIPFVEVTTRFGHFDHTVHHQHVWCWQLRAFSAKQFTATRGKKVFFCIGFAFIYHVLCKPYFIEARRIANTCTPNKSDQFGINQFSQRNGHGKR